MSNDFPILMTFNVGTQSDDWLREQIAGTPRPHEPIIIQQVIVEGSWEARRVAAAMHNLKHSRHLPYGGCSYQKV